jgi:hypothetical protein
MVIKVSELTVDELKEIISDSVKDSIEDILEDIMALRNEEYVRSIEEARDDHREGRVKEGRVKKFEEIFE